MSNSNTASSVLRGLLVAAVLLLAAANCALALKHFKVGGQEGWQEPSENETSMYGDWATRKRFHVGDSLVFVYKNDSVLAVDKWSYYHCNTSNPIIALDNGNSTITFDRPGPFYFVSGRPNHCNNGQRLLVNVMHPHPHHDHHRHGAANSPDISPAGSPISDSVSSPSSVKMAPLIIAFTAAIFMVSTFYY